MIIASRLPILNTMPERYPSLSALAFILLSRSAQQSQFLLESEVERIAQKENLKMEMRRDVAFRCGRIYLADRQGKPVGHFRRGGEGHEAIDRVSVVCTGWNWFGAHDAGGAGAFLG